MRWKIVPESEIGNLKGSISEGFRACRADHAVSDDGHMTGRIVKVGTSAQGLRVHGDP